jgi:UDPglucose 6-dehydrogenase
MTEGGFEKNILCIGAGYVGGPTMAVIAQQCPHYKVTLVDINHQRIDEWNSDCLPIYEPGLEEVVHSARGKNLFFSTDIEAGIRAADIIFVSVNTPTKTFGVGAGMAADLQYWEKTARQILECSNSSKIIVEKSTLPVRTAQAMERILNSNHNGLFFDVLSNPEFLAEGTAIKDLLEPDRVLVGSRLTESGTAARQQIVDIYANWVPRQRIVTSDIWSSELSKLVSNVFLSQRISTINAISALCEKTEADVNRVAKAVGMDHRIGAKYLNASIGFGGSCFKKDILNLVYISKHYGLDLVADYLHSIVQINDYQKERFVENMLYAMFNTLAGKRICIFGFAFKADTGDTRESAAIYIARRLLEEQAQLVVSDPQALRNAKVDLADVADQVAFVEDPYQAADGAHALAVLTEWSLYRGLDYEKIFAAMQKPAFLFDGRNIVDHQQCYEIGFNVYPIGRVPLTHLD